MQPGQILFHPVLLFRWCYVNIANTSLHWNGKDWAMVMLPLPTNKQDRINLIAEYTGEIISGRNKEQAVAHFEKSIDNFLSNPTFVRSFPYQTIPVYGYLLHNTNKDWNKQITIKTNLTNYFIKAFNLSLPYDLKKTVEIISSQYDGQKIFKEETARETKTKLLVAEYKNKFIEQPHF